MDLRMFRNGLVAILLVLTFVMPLKADPAPSPPPSTGAMKFLRDWNFGDGEKAPVKKVIHKKWKAWILESATSLYLQRVIPRDSFAVLRTNGILDPNKLAKESWTPIPGEDKNVVTPSIWSLPKMPGGSAQVITLDLLFKKPGRHPLFYRIVGYKNGVFYPIHKGWAPFWIDVVAEKQHHTHRLGHHRRSRSHIQ